MDSTRQRILEQLSSKHSLSANDLSQALGTTAANMRHHLGILLQEGAVEIVDSGKVQGAAAPPTSMP